MTTANMEGLPPELQQRIAGIIEQAKAQTPAPVPQQAPPAPVQRQPSLMDHTIALRQEVAALSAQLNAVAQVTDAVGQAVGQMYQMFQTQTEVTDYSTNYQTQEQLNDPADY